MYTALQDMICSYTICKSGGGGRPRGPRPPLEEEEYKTKSQETKQSPNSSEQDKAQKY